VPEEVTTGSAIRVVAGQAGRRRPQFAAFAEQFDAAFGVLETRVAKLRQRHAALVQRERLLQREIAVFELFHDRLELGDGRFEIPNGVVRR
jgi:hypothetical protein